MKVRIEMVAKEKKRYSKVANWRIEKAKSESSVDREKLTQKNEKKD